MVWERLRRFRKDTRAGVAMLTALAMLPILGMTGLAVDFARAHSARVAIAGALDNAVLAATRELSTGLATSATVEALVRAYFAGNLSANDVTGIGVPRVTVTVNPLTGTVTATSELDVPTTFMRVLDFDELTVGTAATATYSTKIIELSLILDVTGSMEEPHQKMVDLRAAATDLISTLLPADGRMNARVRIAIVPFANSVNVRRVGSMAYGYDIGNYCVKERPNDNYREVAPSVITANAGSMQVSPCTPQQALPLSNDRAALLTAISTLSGNGGTAGHVGITWGWYMLSPLWRDVMPTANDPALYSNTNVMKIIVFMTDGEFNTPDTTRSPNWASAYCTNAKAAGITIYTIGFQVPTVAQTLMRNCATSSANFYNTSTGTELRSAFATIAYNVNGLWLSN